MKTKSILINKNEEIYNLLKEYLSHKNFFKYFIEHDLRGKLFSIEGILRLHIKNNALSNKDLKIANKLLIEYKEFEDILGKVDLNLELSQLTNKKNIIPKDIHNFTIEYLKLYITKHWDTKKFNSLIKKIKKIKFPKNDNKTLKKMIKNEIIRIGQKTSDLKSLIMVNSYSHNNLENGFHEWRRSIRWISIYLQAYPNQFFLKPKKKDLKSKLYLKYKNNKFTKFMGIKKDIKINQTKYLLLSEYIADIGKIKEKGEHKIYINKSYKNLEKDAQDIYKKFESDKILRKMIK